MSETPVPIDAGKERITIGERIAAACLSALLMAIMTVCVPIGAMLVVTRGRGVELLGIFGTFHIWGVSLIFVAGIAGAILGTDRVTSMFGHLWGTEEPQDRGLTALLWLAILGIGLASCWVFSRHRVL